MSAEIEQSTWPDLPIVCPHCGNHGEPGGAWKENGWVPFKLIQEVVRAWEFDAVQRGGGLLLTADGGNEITDWKSNTLLRLECVQCFASFPIPVGARVEFD